MRGRGSQPSQENQGVGRGAIRRSATLSSLDQTPCVAKPINQRNILDDGASGTNSNSCPSCDNPDDRDMNACHSSEYWYHYACEKLNQTVSKSFNANKGTKYYSINCQKHPPIISTTDADANDSKLDKLIRMNERTNEKLDDIRKDLADIWNEVGLVKDRISAVEDNYSFAKKKENF